jgi:predicted Rdx family selenoprotein
LRDETGIEATLILGGGGIFEVAIEGEVVARKDLSGFPDEDAVIQQVSRRLAALGR